MTTKVRDIVQYAASGDWGIPEFQREFEWKPDQVAKLCNSLYRDLPVGIVTVWNTTKYNEPQKMPPSGRRPLWIVDGQQRIISFCIIAGKRPHWMDNENWNKALKTHRVYLNIEEQGKPTIGRQSPAAKVHIPLDELIHRPPSEVQKYVYEKCTNEGISNCEEACDHAVNGRQILERIVPYAELGDDKGVEDVADTYRRLNQQGTRLRQGQIMLAYVSQYNRGWVREEFYPFLDNLNNTDEWELDPAQILQVATILAEGKARVGEASDNMWKSKIKQIWPKLREAVEETLLHLFDRGITEQDMVPSDYTLITLFAIVAKFKAHLKYDFDPVFRWFVLANLSGRYGDAPLETLTNDSHILFEASDINEALNNLSIPWTKDDIRKSVNQSFRDNSSQALLLHVLLWTAQARDWFEKLSIPALTQAPRKLEPHWHHIVPKAWSKRNDFEDSSKTANVTSSAVRQIPEAP